MQKLTSTTAIMSMTRQEVEKYNELAMQTLKKERMFKCVTCNR